jgi:hypothetical protein
MRRQTPGVAADRAPYPLARKGGLNGWECECGDSRKQVQCTGLGRMASGGAIAQTAETVTTSQTEIGAGLRYASVLSGPRCASSRSSPATKFTLGTRSM